MENLVQTIGIIIGIQAGIMAFIWWIFKKFISTFTELHIESVKNGYDRELEKFKSELEKSRTETLRYSGSQFDIYNSLWNNLQDLKDSAEQLWSSPLPAHLQNFSNNLKSVSKVLRRTKIFLEEQHLTELENLLKLFVNYEDGKKFIITEWQKATPDEIRNMTNKNSINKERCYELIESIGKTIKNKLSNDKIN
ncbi:MAG: hypothetical protein IPJ06_12890 [Saprospiraceae bacterium]|nr:hypothetical protein [Saprospiraceae bacterium]